MVDFDPAAPIEAGNPIDDPAAFRRCLGQFATGVTVITASGPDGPVGMTANSFSSVSLDPPMVLWSAKRQSPSFSAFEAATHFAINVLGSDQVAASKHFGKSGPDKFDGVAWTPGAGGAPILRGVVASFECRRIAAHPGGDHVIFVGEVERFARFDRDVLLFAQGRYAVASDHPEAVASAGGGTSDQRLGPMNEFLTALLYRAHGELSEALEEGRRAEGLTLLQTRLMSAIETLPGRTLEQLLPHLFLGANAAQGTVGELIAMGVIWDGGAGLRLTALGTERNRSLLARARTIEARNLQGVSASDIAATRRVLAHLIEDRPVAMESQAVELRHVR